jgi:hypothetical protein
MRGFHTGPRLSPAEALPVLLVALGLSTDKIPIAVDAQAALYRSTLAGRRVLVILDNVADPDQVRPLLPAVPGCLVLVTSRDRLSGLVAIDGARRITLDVLPAADSVTVLAHTAGRHRFDADPGAAAELAGLCGHLPLALRIAGARLADRPGLGLQVFVKEFSARGPMSHLQVDGDDTASVRGAFDLSYQALTPKARRMFRLLGLVPTPAGLTVPAVAALSGLPGNEVQPLVEALARFHLVNLTASGRLVCRDLLLHYAARLADEQDAPTDRNAAIDRLLHFYIHSTDLAAKAPVGLSQLRLPRDPLPAGVSAVQFQDHDEARQWVTTEWANLMAAFEFADRSGRSRIAWQLADAVRDVVRRQGPLSQWFALANPGHTRQTIRRLERSLAIDRHLGDDPPERSTWPARPAMHSLWREHTAGSPPAAATCKTYPVAWTTAGVHRPPDDAPAGDSHTLAR